VDRMCKRLCLPGHAFFLHEGEWGVRDRVSGSRATRDTKGSIEVAGEDEMEA